MSRAWLNYLVNAAVAGGLTFVFGWAAPHVVRPPVKPNRRGVPLPLSLGHALTLGLVAVDVGLLPAVLFHVVVDGSGVPQKTWVLMAACLAVFAAGTYDDRQPQRTRGVAAQIRALGTGTVTPGVVKLVVLVAASAAWALITGSSTVRVALGTPVIAGVANAWNLLDVVPGRAMKAGLLAAIPLFVYRPTRFTARIVAVTAVGLAPDLRERAMLGRCRGERPGVRHRGGPVRPAGHPRAGGRARRRAGGARGGGDRDAVARDRRGATAAMGGPPGSDPVPIEGRSDLNLKSKRSRPEGRTDGPSAVC